MKNKQKSKRKIQISKLVPAGFLFQYIPNSQFNAELTFQRTAIGIDNFHIILVIHVPYVGVDNPAITLTVPVFASFILYRQRDRGISEVLIYKSLLKQISDYGFGFISKQLRKKEAKQRLLSDIANILITLGF